MFVNNATDQWGLVCQYDGVCLGEVSDEESSGTGISFIMTELPEAGARFFEGMTKAGNKRFFQQARFGGWYTRTWEVVMKSKNWRGSAQ